MLIPFFDAHIVVPPLHIEFGIKMCSTEVPNEGLNEGKWVIVADGVFVDGPIILYQA